MKYLNKKNKKSRFVILVLICFLVSGTYLFSVNTVYGNEGENFPTNQNMRIGLVYDNGIVESFQASSADGFIFGYVNQNASDKFNVFFYLKNTKISVAHIANLTKNSAGRYYASSSNIAVGKYNIEFNKTFSDFAEAYNFIGTLNRDIFKNVFSAYIDGKIVVRYGSFTTADSARNNISSNSQNSPVGLNLAAESNKTTVVINPDTNDIIFQYEDGNNNFAAAAAPASGTNLIYGQSIKELSSKNTGFMTSSSNNLYSGAFVYRVNNVGVEVINLLSLEEYVKGIIPYEISPSWHEEALKAFSVAVRTYALKSMNRHASSGFMLCNDTHCQLFLGSRRATDYTNAAVDATKDLVITYNNELIEAVYHSSSGGVTENHNDAWGGDLRFPYLSSVKLPFEKYASPERNNGIWTRTVSPRELYDYLVGASPQSSRFKGKINSDISSIIINERSPSSNYIKSVSVIDKNGNSVTVRNSDTIRSTFGRYASSANLDIYRVSKFKSIALSPQLEDNNINNSRVSSQDIESGKTYIITGNGVTKSTPGDGVLNVLSATGMYSVRAYATGSDFIFDGKGWGHGVGLSQWAMQDLAELGYKYEEIVKTFYTGVTIESVTNVKK